MDLSTAEWRKSSRSGTNGCVEVAFLEGQVMVRDSKNPDGPVLVFSDHEWTTFLSGAREGEFDLQRRSVVQQSA